MGGFYKFDSYTFDQSFYDYEKEDINSTIRKINYLYNGFNNETLMKII